MALDLCALATEAIDAFNDAEDNNGYEALGPYLCAQHVIIHRVDDATPIQGSSKDMIHLLNSCQIGLWPRFDYKACVPGLTAEVVIVTGDYYDRVGAPAIPITCSYHFTNGKIDSAFAVPLPKVTA